MVMRALTRRNVLHGIGSVVALVGCGSESLGPAVSQVPDAGPLPRPDGGAVTPDAAAPDAGREPSAEELLSTIDAVVVLMMENRSFDHYFGQLKQDATYPGRALVEGHTGTEANLSEAGVRTPIFKLTDFTVADPPHGWAASHAQFNEGKNDGFVKAHAGPQEVEVMGFHDRSQIPFYYWLADNYTVCDHWFASVMGPTWPNRYYLHATTSGGKKDNTPFLVNAPRTVWEVLQAKDKSFANYSAGAVAWYTGGFVANLLRINPVKRIDKFFDDAKAGTLPNFSIIDPDFLSSDDHPDHDIMRGQAFVASVYKAITESPQWNETLFVITYDEHGGFFDHVPPPKTTDPDPEFEQLGFRVPAIVIGPTVRRGYVNRTQMEHSSVAATLKTRFAVESLGPRMNATADLSTCIDPAAYKAPRPPAINPPVVVMSRNRALYERMGSNSQEELDAMIARGQIPKSEIDPRSTTARTAAWMAHGEALGAVRLTR
jgi:phospholipase C